MSAQWLNQESFDRLALELEQLTTVKRAEIVGRIEAARSEGDLKENGGYHAAKEEQGRIEGRIRQLTAMLKNAHVGTEPVDECPIHGDGYYSGQRRSIIGSTSGLSAMRASNAAAQARTASQPGGAAAIPTAAPAPVSASHVSASDVAANALTNGVKAAMLQLQLRDTAPDFFEVCHGRV